MNNNNKNDIYENDNDKYYWYLQETNTYLSKNDSKPIIEQSIKFEERLMKKINNAYKNYEIILSKANEYKDKRDANYLFGIGEAISFICMEFEEIIKENDKLND